MREISAVDEWTFGIRFREVKLVFCEKYQKWVEGTLSEYCPACQMIIPKEKRENREERIAYIKND